MVQAEKTKCSRCGLELTGMVSFRCPRCNNLLLTPCHCDGNCTKCNTTGKCSAGGNLKESSPQSVEDACATGDKCHEGRSNK